MAAAASASSSLFFSWLPHFYRLRSRGLGPLVVFFFSFDTVCRIEGREEQKGAGREEQIGAEEDGRTNGP